MERILNVVHFGFRLFSTQYGRSRLVTEFEKLNRIGEGTYGVVCEYGLLAILMFHSFETLNHFGFLADLYCCVRSGT